ncbi:hypothetical protein [Salidesulfovibrio onnuriiensis]|uniref:hypothetical protein n=1 Tax=Salidesulfovibrio onnuriiensis TaxID=2583823 RepID=UPI0011C82D85|nr:hypothetical protein [Salidesulfovibrio onnuriiensis]
MSVRQVAQCPKELAYLPCHERFEWFRLGDARGDYAVLGLAEAGEDCLELHLEVTSWGLRARKGLARDMDWLREYARACGKSRILGLKGGEEMDPVWAKFTRLYGFTGYAVVQTAYLDVD